MRNIIGVENTNLCMEPYTGLAESTDVVFVQDNNNYVALVDDHSMQPASPYIREDPPVNNSTYLRIQVPSPYKLADGDYTTQFYLGAVSIVGLFILFRMMQKSRA